MDVNEFRLAYKDIVDLSSRLNSLVSSVSVFMAGGIETLSNEFDYGFVNSEALRQQLFQASKRMVTARIGHLYSDANIAFEDFSRAVQLQLEGLTNTWFNQHYFIDGKNIDSFTREYFNLKVEQFFTFDRVTRQVYDDFKLAINVLPFSEDDFYQDFYNLDKKNFISKYEQIFLGLRKDISTFADRIFRVDKKEKIERVQYLVKAEFVFLRENGVKLTFTKTPINRLNEMRNAALSHAGTGYDKSKQYYKELFDKPNRTEILILAFVQYYNQIKERVAPILHPVVPVVVEPSKPQPLLVKEENKKKENKKNFNFKKGRS